MYYSVSCPDIKFVIMLTAIYAENQIRANLITSALASPFKGNYVNEYVQQYLTVTELGYLHNSSECTTEYETIQESSACKTYLDSRLDY